MSDIERVCGWCKSPLIFRKEYSATITNTGAKTAILRFYPKPDPTPKAGYGD